MNSSLLNPCPICGKQPKMYAEMRSGGYGGWCTIRCKPLFRKPHMIVESGKSTLDRAIKYAVEDWNRMCEEYESNGAD